MGLFHSLKSGCYTLKILPDLRFQKPLYRNYSLRLNIPSRALFIIPMNNAKRISNKSLKYVGNSNAKSLEEKTNIPNCIKLNASGTISIAIHAKPGSKQAAVTNVGPESVGVQINAPAREGEANSALIEFVSDVLNVKKRQVSLSKAGSKSREKVLLVEDITVEEAYSALIKAAKVN